MSGLVAEEPQCGRLWSQNFKQVHSTGDMLSKDVSDYQSRNIPVSTATVLGGATSPYHIHSLWADVVGVCEDVCGGMIARLNGVTKVGRSVAKRDKLPACADVDGFVPLQTSGQGGNSARRSERCSWRASRVTAWEAVELDPFGANHHRRS